MMAKNHPPMGVVLRVWWSMGWRQAAGIVAASLVFGLFGLFGGGSFEAGAGAGIALVSIPLMLWVIREALAVHGLGVKVAKDKATPDADETETASR